MQLLWVLLSLLVAVKSAVPDGPRLEGSKRFAQTVDCNGAVVFSAVTSEFYHPFTCFFIYFFLGVLMFCCIIFSTEETLLGI